MGDMQGKETQRDLCLVGLFDFASSQPSSEVIFIVSLLTSRFFISLLIYNNYEWFLHIKRLFFFASLFQPCWCSCAHWYDALGEKKVGSLPSRKQTSSEESRDEIVISDATLVCLV